MHTFLVFISNLINTVTNLYVIWSSSFVKFRLMLIYFFRFSSSLAENTLTWETVFKKFSDGVSNVQNVIDALLSLPPTSVNNETTFSRTKLTKGKRRGNLKTETLKDLVQVDIETPSIEQFDPKPAINNWMVTIYLKVISFRP